MNETSKADGEATLVKNGFRKNGSVTVGRGLCGLWLSGPDEELLFIYC